MFRVLKKSICELYTYRQIFYFFRNQDKTVSVAKTYLRRNKQDIISAPKTKTSIRDVSLPGFIFDLLDEYTDLLHGYESDQRLFTSVRSWSIDGRIKKAAEHSDLTKITIHGFRHSHASLLIHTGERPKVIQHQLGHKDIQTTMNTYSHLYPDNQQRLTNKLDDLSPF